MSDTGENRLRVLLVEDDPPSRFFASTVIKLKFPDFLTAENGEEGLKIYKEHKPDIVVSDIGMPKMNGLDMARKIREINPEAQIILTTAFDNKSQLLDAIDIGINKYIVKPVNKQRLLQALERAAEDIDIKIKLRKQYEHINMLSRALQESPSPILVLDSKGRIEYFNQRFAHLFSIEEKKTHCAHFSEVLTASQFREALEKVFEKKNEAYLWKGEISVSTADNHESWLAVSIFPVKSESGEIKNIVAELEDITQKELSRKALEEANTELDRRVKERTEDLRSANEKLREEIDVRIETEKELIKAKEEAEAANRAKSSFLAKVSHELRTPMNGIIGLTSILFGTELNRKQKKFLEMVKYSADNLLNIINDILDFSKLEAGKLRIKNAPFNLSVSIERAVGLMKSGASEKGLELKMEIDGRIPKIVSGDSKRIEQILLNLIGNSVKFTDKGYIKVKAELAKETKDNIDILFSVKDSGIGIPLDKKALLFQSFSQVEDTMTRKHGGTGLGLVISKELTELMGGSIGFESEEGKGSLFYFTLPLGKKTGLKPADAERAEDFETAAQTAEKYPEVSLNILIAEDSIINQEVMKQVFMQKSWLVTSVLNGREAVEIYKNGSFDMIFMDVQMPEMDGYEAAKKIREHEKKTGKHTPIIGLTAHSDEKSRQMCIDAGMDAFVAKPFQWEEIFDTIFSFPEINSEKSIEEPPADLTGLKNSLSGKKSILINLINYFIENYGKELSQLENYFQEKNTEKIRQLAHKMKSECGNFNAGTVVSLARQIENAAKNKDLDTASGAFDSFKYEMKKLEKFLLSELNKLKR